MALSSIREKIRTIEDYPVPGVRFKDITPVLEDRHLFREAIGRMVGMYEPNMRVDKVVAVESRGFIFAIPMALHWGAGLVMARKPDKLPYRVISCPITLEYGETRIEVHEDSILPGESVVIVDDLLATGGTAEGARTLVERSGGIVVSIAFFIELAWFHGRKKLGAYDVRSLLVYDSPDT